MGIGKAPQGGVPVREGLEGLGGGIEKRAQQAGGGGEGGRVRAVKDEDGIGSGRVERSDQPGEDGQEVAAGSGRQQGGERGEILARSPGGRGGRLRQRQRRGGPVEVVRRAGDEEDAARQNLEDLAVGANGVEVESRGFGHGGADDGPRGIEAQVSAEAALIGQQGRAGGGEAGGGAEIVVAGLAAPPFVIAAAEPEAELGRVNGEDGAGGVVFLEGDPRAAAGIGEERSFRDDPAELIELGRGRRETFPGVRGVGRVSQRVAQSHTS